jgi:hypothetical protein
MWICNNNDNTTTSGMIFIVEKWEDSLAAGFRVTKQRPFWSSFHSFFAATWDQGVQVVELLDQAGCCNKLQSSSRLEDSCTGEGVGKKRKQTNKALLLNGFEFKTKRIFLFPLNCWRRITHEWLINGDQSSKQREIKFAHFKRLRPGHWSKTLLEQK